MTRLRVLAGPSPSALTNITDIVNTSTPTPITSDLFEGLVVVNVKGLTNERGEVLDSEYFQRVDRKGITWSIQVQGRFLEPYSADDVLFGNTFDRPLKLPWGTSAALAFMKLVDPTLEHDLMSPTRPWALSPLISTMPHFMHERIPSSASQSSSSSSRSSLNEPCDNITPRATTFRLPKPTLPPFPTTSVADDTSQLHLIQTFVSELSSSSNSSLSSTLSSSSILSNGSRKGISRRGKSGRSGLPLNLQKASDRRSYFASPKHRQEVYFGPNDILTMDFCYGFLEFNPSLALCLPGGVSFDLMKYWDGQPVRFVCCERKRTEGVEGEDPWGRVFWCVTIEIVE